MRTDENTRLAIVLGLVLGMASALPAAAQPQTTPLTFANTTFAVTELAFAEYFQHRGGVATFGYPITNAFQFLGFKTQLFERRAMQLGPDGAPRLLNLLDDGLLPYTRINGSTFPAAESALAGTLRSDAPDYTERALELVRRHTPSDFEGRPVRFFETFASSVSCAAAFADAPCDEGLLLLMDLEMWGLPTSLPQVDPANSNFVYQRFQRGIMHYDTACACTQGILLGSYLKGVLSGGNLPADLLAQAKDSPLLGAAARGLAGSVFVGSGIPPLGATFAASAAPVAVESPVPPAQPAVEFGVVVSDAQTNQDVEYLLGQLGVRWWYSFGATGSPIEPAGLERMRLLRTGHQREKGSDAAVTALARAHPGRAWMIGNEPNVPGQDDASPAEYADAFHDFSTALKAGDASAIVVGPNVLNWDFTCVACPGYTSGHVWVDAFRAAYRQHYGAEPPVDVWGIHAYDIDWQHLPMVRIDHVETDLEAVRAYIQAIPEQADKPIWLTEFGIIWAFDGAESVVVDGANQLRPAGSYATLPVNDNVASLVAWLRTRGPDLGIRRALLYATRPPAEPYASVAAGITLFDGPGVGAALTSSGRAYRDAVHR